MVDFEQANVSWVRVKVARFFTIIIMITELVSVIQSVAVSNSMTLRKNYPYSEFFWSAFFRIRTEYGEIRSISPYSVQMRENADHNNSKYGHFSHSMN